MECPPAAAISKARRARCCPFISAMSNNGAFETCGLGLGVAVSKAVPSKCAHNAAKLGAPQTVKPSILAASMAFAWGKKSSRRAR